VTVDNVFRRLGTEVVVACFKALSHFPAETQVAWKPQSLYQAVRTSGMLITQLRNLVL